MTSNDYSIDISVYILTYYHEEYLSRAIESVLAQKTKRKYEILIFDDCSKDDTIKIAGKYCEAYPDIIKVHQNSSNLGIPLNKYKARCSCRGKYIVDLAGDDYWIDDNKLERMACFLDDHSEYLGVSNSMEVRFNSNEFPYQVLPDRKYVDREYSLIDYENGIPWITDGLMFRNLFLDKDLNNHMKKALDISGLVDDAVDKILLLQCGKFYVLPDISNVHRILQGENLNNYNSRYSRLEKMTHSIELDNNLELYFGKTIDFRRKYTIDASYLLLFLIASSNRKDYWDLYKSIPMKFRKPFYRNVLILGIPRALKMGVNYVNRKVRRDKDGD